MKLVYTDENPKLKVLSELINSDAFISYIKANIKKIQEYDMGTNRVKVLKTVAQVNDFLQPYGLFVTNEVEHAHKIGNNNSFYVKDCASEERIGCLSINDDMFGRVYCFAEDVNKKKVSNVYHIGGYDKLSVESRLTPDWSRYPFYKKMAAQKHGSSENNKVFLLSKADKSWAAVVSDGTYIAGGAMLANEQSYPVEVYFRRTDLNGSVVVERETCLEREDLLGLLNWIGDCGFVVLDFWDFDLERVNDKQLLQMFEDAVDRRMEKIVAEQDRMLEVLGEEPAAVPVESDSRQSLEELIDAAEGKASAAGKSGKPTPER